MAGIGCHYMAVWMDRSTSTFTQMGGEGVPWVGQAPFTTEKHIFANLGDGTYFHSGLLAIRQSIAAGVNITYKILYNDAVAMTGGQQVGERPEGHSVLQIMKSLRRRGRDEARHRHRRAREVRRRRARARRHGAPPRRARPHPARVPRDQGHHRHHLRPDLRHREAPPPQARHAGRRRTSASSSTSWSAKAAATARCRATACRVEPVETEFGRKRRINQNTCNKDYSCVKGFCPSFVTVEGGQLKKPKKEAQGRPVRAAAAARADAAAGRDAPGASSSAASAAPASSRSASCSAWRRTSKARASSRRTPAAWRKRAARPGATSRSPTGPTRSTPPRSTPRKADLVIACDAIVGASKYTLARDARGPHLRRAEHARHADRGLRAATPTGSSPAATARPRCAPAVGDATASAPSMPSRWRCS